MSIDKSSEWASELIRQVLLQNSDFAVIILLYRFIDSRLNWPFEAIGYTVVFGYKLKKSHGNV